MRAKTVHYTELRTNLAAYLDLATKLGGKPIIVKRRGKASVALIDAAELSSIMETLHLLRSPANARALFAALEETHAGKAKHYRSVEEYIAGSLPPRAIGKPRTAP